jgi:hypothetical protein
VDGMFKDKLLDILKRSRNSEREEKETTQAMDKIERQKRLSSEEFLKIYDALWKEGPSVKYQNPDAWNSHLRETSNSP